MLRSLLLASAFALAAPAMAQEVQDDMAPPNTEGMTAPDAQDQTAPNLPPGTVPTGTTEEAVDHSTMGHTDTGSTSMTTDTETSTTGTTGTMTTATTGEEADSTADTTTPTQTMSSADATAPTSTTGTFTGMGGPADIQASWSSFDTISDGRLNPMEFATWMSDAMGRPANADSGDQAVELLNESADELALVDTDGDWHVSQAELTAASPQ